MNHYKINPAGKEFASPLPRLIERGDKVEIIKGRLYITPKSGLPIPDQWLKEHEKTIVLDMANLTDQLYFTYAGYDCGYYGQHKAGGLNIQLTNMDNHKNSYTIFNVGLERQRNSKKAKAGARLPKGQFTLTIQHGFYKFWLATGLKIPDKRKSRLWAHMGNLKPLHFTGSYDPKDVKQEKVLTTTLIPLNVSYESLVKVTEFIHKPYTSHTQVVHSTYTNPIHKETGLEHDIHGLQPNITTGLNNYGKRLKGKEVNGNPYTPRIQSVKPIKKRPQDQSEEEWLADYDAEAANPTFHLNQE
jgi:hypothetical protein